MGWEPLPNRGASEPRRLSEGLDRVARTMGASSASSVVTVFTRWEELVGAAVSANTRPLTLRDHELVIGAEDPAWSTQVRLLEPVLLERLAALVGEGVVTSLRVRVDPR